MIASTMCARVGRLVLAACLTALLGACATPASYDYTAFKQSRPASMLILPPVNDSTEVMATHGVLAQATQPLAEAGYYVLPVSLVDETFKENGLTTAADIQEVSTRKLREIFGADAAVYLRVKEYGTSYRIVSSETTVAVEGRIVDLRTGQLLWQGSAQASSAERNNANTQGGLVGMLVSAVVKQIVGTVTDESFTYAGVANQRLLGPRPNGVLHGPRSPQYMKD